jgi:hypothetical protein
MDETAFHWQRVSEFFLAAHVQSFHVILSVVGLRDLNLNVVSIHECDGLLVGRLVGVASGVAVGLLDPAAEQEPF